MKTQGKRSALRLFGLKRVVGGALLTSFDQKPAYFNSKRLAKHKRDILREKDGVNSWVVILGPDHRRYHRHY